MKVGEVCIGHFADLLSIFISDQDVQSDHTKCVLRLEGHVFPAFFLDSGITHLTHLEKVTFSVFSSSFQEELLPSNDELTLFSLLCPDSFYESIGNR